MKKTGFGWCLVVVSLAAALTCASGCRSQQAPRKPVAMATIFAYYDALQAIAGPDVDCVCLLPAKVSPHEYEPTMADHVAAARAGLIIKNGLHLDDWADKLTADNTAALRVDMGQVLKDKGIAPLATTEESLTTQGSSQPSGDLAEHVDVSAGNPHIWLDPRVQGMAAEAIRDALIKLDPGHAEGFKARAAAYLKELDQLDHDFAQAAKGFRQREFIGFHSAYDYLARRYGLTQAASVEELPAQGPSLAQEVKIIQLIRDKKIKVIFLESAFPSKVADRILEETGVKTGILQPLETYDSLDQTYVSLMRQNLQAMKAAME